MRLITIVQFFLISVVSSNGWSAGSIQVSVPIPFECDTLVSILPRLTELYKIHAEAMDDLSELSKLYYDYRGERYNRGVSEREANLRKLILAKKAEIERNHSLNLTPLHPEVPGRALDFLDKISGTRRYVCGKSESPKIDFFCKISDPLYNRRVFDSWGNLTEYHNRELTILRWTSESLGHRCFKVLNGYATRYLEEELSKREPSTTQIKDPAALEEMEWVEELLLK